MLVLFVKETLLNAKSLYDRVQWALNNNNNNNKCKTRAVTFLKRLKSDQHLDELHSVDVRLPTIRETFRQNRKTSF